MIYSDISIELVACLGQAPKTLSPTVPIIQLIVAFSLDTFWLHTLGLHISNSMLQFVTHGSLSLAEITLATS